MPFLLHLETSTRMCSVALSEKGRLLALKELGEEYTHAENLTLFIEDVCKQTGRSLQELDAICISKGPGSYTGLRIGVSTAKGLCYALSIPLIAIATLDAMTQGYLQKKNESDVGILGALPLYDQIHPAGADVCFLCPMLDARRLEVYTSVYDALGRICETVSAKIIDNLSFSDFLDKGRVIFFGDGAEKCKTILTHANARFVEHHTPSAQFLIPLAEVAYANRQFEDVAYFEPFYLKDFYVGP